MFRKLGQPFKITIIYIVVGVVWVYITTYLLNIYFRYEMEKHVNKVHVFVRLSFIGLSAILIYYLIFRYNRNLKSKVTEYNNLFDKNPNPMWIYDLQSLRFLAVNEAAIVRYGYSREEFLLKTIMDIRPAEDEARVRSSLASAPSNLYTSGHWRHLKKNGDMIWVEITSSPVEWNGKNAELILSHDVSDRVRAEMDLRDMNAQLEERIQERTRQLDIANLDLAAINEELTTSNEELMATNEQLAAAQAKIVKQADALVHQSEERLNRIVSTIKDIVWSARYEGGTESEIDFINKATLDIYGFPPEAFLTNKSLMAQRLPEEERDQLIGQVLHDLAKDDFSKLEHRIINWQGQSRWVNSRIWLTHDDNGNPVRLHGIMSDITQQKKTEHELSDQRETLQKLIDSLPLIITIINDRGELIFINQAWENVLHWKSFEVIGSPMLKRLFPDKELRKKALAFVNSAEERWADFKTTTRRGTQIDVSWFIIRRPDGSSIAIGQDISQRKKQEEEKALLLQQLVIQNNDLVQFSFIASHNLRGPVATMLGLTQIIKQLKIEDPELLRILTYLYTSADKLNEVIKDLNTVLEIRNDHFQAKQWINIQDVFLQVMKSFENFDMHALDIRTDFSGCERFFTIPSYFHNILYNLLSNAIKFRSPDNRTLIEIRTFKTPRLAGFSVKDNGIGLDLEQFGQKVFTLYQRFHLEFEGKGLGLYLVRTQVYSLNGSIDVSSKPGEGSEFTVSFPLPDTLKI